MAVVNIPGSMAVSACAVCGRPATVFVNRTAGWNSAQVTDLEPRCPAHDPLRLAAVPHLCPHGQVCEGG